MKQKLFEIIQVPVCLPTDEFNFALFFTKTKWAPKLLLGRQNRVISTGGCLNLMPGLTLEHRRCDRPYTYSCYIGAVLLQNW